MPSCKDCGLFYDQAYDEELHQAFCLARICSVCEEIFTKPLPVYGHSMIAGEPDTRICEKCAASLKEERASG